MDANMTFHEVYESMTLFPVRDTFPRLILRQRILVPAFWCTAMLIDSHSAFSWHDSKAQAWTRRLRSGYRIMLGVIRTVS